MLCRNCPCSMLQFFSIIDGTTCATSYKLIFYTCICYMPKLVPLLYQGGRDLATTNMNSHLNSNVQIDLASRQGHTRHTGQELAPANSHGIGQEQALVNSYGIGQDQAPVNSYGSSNMPTLVISLKSRRMYYWEGNQFVSFGWLQLLRHPGCNLGIEVLQSIRTTIFPIFYSLFCL